MGAKDKEGLRGKSSVQQRFLTLAPQHKYWMSEDQQRSLQVPTLKGSRLFSAVKSVENAGPGKAALEAHEAVRMAAKLGLRAYEAATAFHEKVKDFAPTKLYQENGGAVPELRLLRADSFNMEGARATELARMERSVRQDPRWAASLLVRNAWATRENEARHRRLLSSLADVEVLAMAGKAYAELSTTISWDGVQACGQVDLAVSAVRRAQVEGLLTDKMKSRLRGELADSAARRRRDGGNFLLAAEVDKLVAEETRTTSRLAQVGTAVSWPAWLVLFQLDLFLTCSLQVVKTPADKGGRGKYSGGQGTGGSGGHGNSGYSGGYAGGGRGGGRGSRLTGADR